MTVKLATSRLPPQTILNFNENEIFLWHKFAGGEGGGGGGLGGRGEGGQGMDAKPSQNILSVVVESYVEIN